MSHRNLLWVNPYLDNFKRYEELNQVYASYFEGPERLAPARSTVAVAELPRKALVEIECIALVE